MALIGPRDLSTLVNMTGWDADELQKFTLQDGTTYEQIAGELAVGVAALNTELVSDPLYASLVSFTDQPSVDYSTGAGTEMDDHTEYSRGDSYRSEMEGHMLPLLKKDKTLKWTWDYLQEARLSHIRNDIRVNLDAVRTTYRKAILGRLLKQGDDSGASKGLGATGLSPGFATTAASTGVDFVPPEYAGTTFTSTHEHYVAIAGGLFTAAVFTDAKDELREHGHEPNYEALISKHDEATVRGLTGFVPVSSNLVAHGANQDLAILPTLSGGKSYYIGTIADTAVRVVPGMPQYYGVVYKSYGLNSPMNPLKVRVPKGQARPMVMAMTDPMSGVAISPLVNLMLWFQFGVGVYDRTAATPRYVNNAAWSDGTPG